MRPAQRLFLIITLTIVFCIAGFYFYISPKYVVPILMYHHIDEQGKTSSLSVSPDNFSRQMRFLSERNYNVISLAEFVLAIKQGQRLSKDTVVLTFDDGYEDNYICAYPVLKRYSLPATIFVIVDSIDKEGYLNYTQIRQMISSGIIDIGSHTLSGDYLPGKTKAQLERQIGDSKRILQTNLNRSIDLLCYPIGGFTAQIEELAEKYGYKAACTTNRGRRKIYLNEDIYALKRIKIKDGPFNLFVFWVKLSGYYNLFRKVKEPHQ